MNIVSSIGYWSNDDFESELSAADPWHQEHEWKSGAPDWENADWQQRMFERDYHPLSSALREEMGLGATWTFLGISRPVNNRVFIAERNCSALRITVRCTVTDDEHRIELPVVSKPKPRDRHGRFFIRLSNVKKYPILVDLFTPSGLLTNLSASSDVAVARLIAALTGRKVHYDLSKPVNERLNVHHINFNCSDDRFWNLEVLTQREHYDKEKKHHLDCERQAN